MNMIAPDNQVDLWCAFLDEGDAPDLEQLYRSVLSPDEARRAARFHFEKDRRQFLLTRALVRDVLSRYVGAAPSALVFARNEYGKPALAHPAGCPVAFSLSHTQGLSVCAVASAQMIGVDVERLDRANCHPDIAKRFFAPAESAYLEGLAGDERRLEFLRLWTLKEAFVKARGKGLSIPLNSFTINARPGRPARVSWLHVAQDKEGGWRFLKICVSRTFQIAVAVPMAQPKTIVVRLRRIVPLTERSMDLVLEPNPQHEWAPQLSSLPDPTRGSHIGSDWS